MRILVTIIIILLLLRWLLKPLIKFTVQTTFSKMAEEAMRRQKQQQQASTKSEGTISVDYIPEKDKRGKGTATTDKGDYIDFEELS